MVGEFGEVLVMDWGLAKVLAPVPDAGPARAVGAPDPVTHPVGATTGSLTRTGLAMGTPAYMAPEQAAGRWDAVDSRSDVFGLGAVLCTLLTGLPPNAVALTPGPTSDPPRSTFARLDESGAPPDLIALCKRCLAPDPTDRPADGAGVAAAVAELRRGAEERARQAELERARAEVHAGEQRKRRRLTMIGAVALALVLVAGIIGTAIGLVRADSAREAAEEARDRARDARSEAEVARDRARNALDAMTSELAEDFLVTQQAPSAEQKQFLTRVLADYRALAGESADDEPARRRTAAAAFRVGKIEDRLGHPEEAVAAFRQALRMYETLAAGDPAAAGYRGDIANCHNNLGIELGNLGRNDEAESHYREALALAERLAADQPDQIEHRRTAGNAHYNLGILLKESGRREEARDQLRRALEIREQLTTEVPLAAHYRREWAAAHDNMGNVLADLGMKAEAEAHYRTALPLLEQVIAAFPTVPEFRRELAVTLNNLGSVQYDLGKFPAAEEHLRRALVLREQQAADEHGAADSRAANWPSLSRTSGNCTSASGRVRKPRTTSIAPWPSWRNWSRTTRTRRVTSSNSATRTSRAGSSRSATGPGRSRAWHGSTRRSNGWPRCAPPTRPTFGRSANCVTAIAGELRRTTGWIATRRRYATGTVRSTWLSPRRMRTRVRRRTGDELCCVRARWPAALADVGRIARYERADHRRAAVRPGLCVIPLPLGTPERRQELADRAMELLKGAVAAGWNDVAQTKQDTDLDPLRTRADFKKLLAELEQRFPPKKYSGDRGHHYPAADAERPWPATTGSTCRGRPQALRWLRLRGVSAPRVVTALEPPSSGSRRPRRRPASWV